MTCEKEACQLNTVHVALLLSATADCPGKAVWGRTWLIKKGRNVINLSSGPIEPHTH